MLTRVTPGLEKSRSADVDLRGTVADAANANLDVKVITSLVELEALRGSWADLRSNPLNDIDYYSMIVRLRPNIIAPYVAVVSKNARIRAILVAHIAQTHLDVRIGYTVVCKPKLKVLAVLYQGLLGAQTPDVTDAVMSALVEPLKQKQVDAVLFNHLAVDSPMFEAALTTPHFLCRDHMVHRTVHWRMILQPNVEGIYASLSRNLRQQLRRKGRILETRFNSEVAVRCYRDSESLEQMFADVEAVARNTYQRQLGVGFLDDQETKIRIDFEARHGWLRMYVLYLNAQPVAFWWGNVIGDTFYSGALGFEPAYAEYSPGSYLMIKAIEDLGTQEVRQIDFGIGDARYKQQFGHQSWVEASIFMFAPTARAIVLNLVRTANEAALDVAKRTLARLKLSDTVRRILRRRLRTPSPSTDS